MASLNSIFSESTFINSPPVFNGEAYSYWKTRMRIFIEAIDIDVWDAIQNGPFIPTKKVKGKIVERLRNEWSNEDKKKMQYDLKAKNIISSALSHDKFFKVSNCKTAKEMWETLEIAHEGTSDDEALNNSGNESTNFALMARKEESDDEVTSSENESECLPSYDELQDAFNELYEESKKLAKKFALSRKNILKLEKEISILNKELDDLRMENTSLSLPCTSCIDHEKEVNDLRTQNAVLSLPCSSCIDHKKEVEKLRTQNASLSLPCSSCIDHKKEVEKLKIQNASLSLPCSICTNHKKEVEDLKNTLSKFTQGRNNLDTLLGKQKCCFDKTGLGFQSKRNEKYYKTFFNHTTYSSSPFITCYYCGKKGHTASKCYARKYGVRNGKMIWVPKEALLQTNNKGPKKIWVPKGKIESCDAGLPKNEKLKVVP